MLGRTDKGLFITTGLFTRDAIAEASRDGAPVIDLIDSVLLVETLKELGLGVSVEFKEEITIDEDWFKNF
jgi:restriction system protein